jgi:hypothetical protein
MRSELDINDIIEDGWYLRNMYHETIEGLPVIVVHVQNFLTDLRVPAANHQIVTGRGTSIGQALNEIRSTLGLPLEWNPLAVKQVPPKPKTFWEKVKDLFKKD